MAAIDPQILSLRDVPDDDPRWDEEQTTTAANWELSLLRWIRELGRDEAHQRIFLIGRYAMLGTIINQFDRLATLVYAEAARMQAASKVPPPAPGEDAEAAGAEDATVASVPPGDEQAGSPHVETHATHGPKSRRITMSCTFVEEQPEGEQPA